MSMKRFYLLSCGRNYEIIVYDSAVHFRKDGRLHRQNGPASIHCGGVECYYYLNGSQVSTTEHARRIKK